MYSQVNSTELHWSEIIIALAVVESGLCGYMSSLVGHNALMWFHQLVLWNSCIWFTHRRQVCFREQRQWINTEVCTWSQERSNRVLISFGSLDGIPGEPSPHGHPRVGCWRKNDYIQDLCRMRLFINQLTSTDKLLLKLGHEWVIPFPYVLLM